MHFIVVMCSKAESASSPLTTLSNDAIVLTVKRENSTELCLASPAACGGENLKTLVPSDNPPSTEDLKEFVEKFKKERLRLGITQNDVGLILGNVISLSYFSLGAYPFHS